MEMSHAEVMTEAAPTVRTYALEFEEYGRTKTYYPIPGQVSLVTDPKGPEAKSVEKMFAYDQPTFTPAWTPIPLD